MSIKRQATTELNHENWDADDQEEQEEMGSFKTASKDILEKRVIRTAKRRSQLGAGSEAKGVFSGFGGFKKAAPSSFDFLANLTNGTKTTNGSSVTKSDAAVTSSLFSSKPLSSSPNTSVFGTQELTPIKSTFGIPSSQSMFGTSQTSSTTTSSALTASKADSTVGNNPFKIQNSTDSLGSKVCSNTDSAGSQVSSTVLGAPSAKSTSLMTSTPFKLQPSNNVSTTPSIFGENKTLTNSDGAPPKPEESNNKKMVYYSKLKGLNESVSDWIKKHVEETPLCILSPIFKDYEKHLKEIQEEYHGPDSEDSSSKKPSLDSTEGPKKMSSPTSNASTLPKNPTTTSNLFSNTAPKGSLFATGSAPLSEKEKSSFSFGIKTPTSNAGTLSSSPSGGFSFGNSSNKSVTSQSPASEATNPSSAAPFSFGIGKPFSFNANTIQKPSETIESPQEDEDQPLKVEYTPVQEENSVYDRRCKIFVKKDGNFVDKGVGTLYIKKIENSEKHQLLVRANTNLGTVLLNLVLVSGIPTQRMGKNNVMLVCIPTPDAKPPPTPILIRVKTGEEADELLETLDKYKA